MTEQWRKIVGFIGYEVSNRGRVRSRFKELVPFPDKDGYLCVGVRGLKRVHFLVLTVFVGPRPIGMEACHNNGIKTDNSLRNLRWDTHKANCADAVRSGTHAGFKRKGERSPLAKLTNEQARAIKLALVSGARGAHLARTYAISPQVVCDIKHGRSWGHINCKETAKCL